MAVNCVDYVSLTRHAVERFGNIMHIGPLKNAQVSSNSPGASFVIEYWIRTNRPQISRSLLSDAPADCNNILVIEIDPQNGYMSYLLRYSC